MKMLRYAWLGGSLSLALALIHFSGAIAAAPTVRSSLIPTLESEIVMAFPPLENTPWQLVSYLKSSGETVAAFSDRPAVFEFQEGRLSGTTGCNRFFSNYTQSGNSLSISPGGSTLMACFPEALAQQEQALLSLLPTVTRYAFDADHLVLLDSRDRVVISLAPQPQADLVGTTWVLEVYNNGRGGLASAYTGTTLTVQFRDDNTLGGSAGCNTYRASYELGEGTLVVGPAASTRKLCQEPEGIMTQEMAFLNLLPTVSTYAIKGNQLEWRNNEGQVLARFTAQP